MSGISLHTLRLNSHNINGKLTSVNKKWIHWTRWNFFCQEPKLASVQDVVETVSYEEEINHDEEENILMKRNKSRLNRQHQNIVHEKPPFEEPIIPYHNTIRYYRKMFGRYGTSSGVDPGILWPTKDELQEKLEYEKVAYPESIDIMVARGKLKATQEQEAIKKRESEIMVKMQKLEQWKRELLQRNDKKLKEAQAAKDKKERLLEEVRQHFGFKIDSRDQRFKELLEKKEKEESKRAKAEKKKLKEARMLEKLSASSSQATPEPESTPVTSSDSSSSDKVN